MKSIITVPSGVLYLSSLIDTLPKGVFNKRLTGCGATSIALEDNNATIIAVPTKKLINNKVVQYPNDRSDKVLFGFHGEVKNLALRSYLDKIDIPKIMVTYDSLQRLSELIDLTKFRIVVDEYQELLKAYSYRDEAIDSLLNIVLNHDYVTYVSATPIPDMYSPREFREMDYTEVVWESTLKVKPIRHKTNKPYNAIVNVIKNYKNNGFVEINGHKSYEALFFINSIKAIRNIIESAELNQSEVKIVCADNEKNQKTLKEFCINDVLDENKMFTFITSTSFVGCDFYSDSAITYVITNYASKHTLLDIDTDLPQIAGRVRSLNNPFKDVLIHVFNTSSAETSEEEFEAEMELRMERTKGLISIYDKANVSERSALKARLSMISENDYAIYEPNNDEVIFNEFKYHHDRFRWNVINNIYTNGFTLREAYLNAGFDMSIAQKYELNFDKFIHSSTKRENFKSLCLYYIEHKQKFTIDDKVKEIELEYPFLIDALTILTPVGLKALSYNQSKIQKHMYSISKEVKFALKTNVLETFTIGERYTNKFIVEMLQNIYDRILLEKKAKVVDLEEWFNIEPIKTSSLRYTLILNPINSGESLEQNSL